MLAVAALAALAATATVTPPQVPAKGRETALLTVGRAGMVRITTSGGGGTACTLVDQLRGPFASAGVAGKRDCALDLLLDAGPYQLLLDSAGKGKRQVTITAAELREQNPEPRRLEPGRPVEQPLPDGTQASFWIRVERREAATIRVAGRTAGTVHLWRSGVWREELAPLQLETVPVAGQPIHESWLEAVLEPGDYLLTAYGTSPKRFTRGAESDLVTVEYGFARAERAFRVVLPASGVATYALPAGPVTAVATAEGAPPARLRLSLHPLDGAGSRLAEEEGSCTVEPRALVPECAARSSGGAGHVLVVRGPPGVGVLVGWAPRSTLPGYVDGEYRDPVERLALEPVPPGEYWLGVHDVPSDPDAAPLGCALEKRPERGGPREIVAWDVPRIAPGHPLQRAFNYPRQASIWFEAPQAALLPAEIVISTGGERRSTCVLYRVQGDGVEKVDEDESGRCRLSRRLSAGLYELRLRGGSEGIEKIRVAEAGTPAGPDSGARGGCALRARLVADSRYALVTNRSGAAQARGLIARRLPAAVEAPLPVEVPAGETVRLPVDARGEIRVASPGAGPAGCHLAQGGAGAWRDGACRLTAAGPDELVLTAKADAPLVAWVGRPPAAPAPAGQGPAHRPAPAELPALSADGPVRLDFEPGQARSLVFDVADAGLYDVGTEGLLATSCTLRTPALAKLADDSRGGRGRNCLVSAYLRPGRYLVSVHAEAPSRGRAGVVLARRAARELPRLDAGGERFFRVEPGELVSQKLAVPKAGRYDVALSALGADLRCRLEDAAGWPLQPVPGPCRATVDLPKGEAVVKALPLTVESMRRSAFAPARPPVVLRGKKPHRIALWALHRAELGKEGKNEFRFELAAEQDVHVLLTNGMLGRLYRQGETQPIELVPPLEAGAAAADPPGGPQRDEDASVAEEVPADEPPAEADGVTDGEPSCEEGACEEPAPRRPSARPPPRPALPALQAAPAGKRIHLAAGAYALVAEHARGDVAVSYEVQIATESLAPGVEREVAVPARLPLLVPSAGTLRLRTTGDADVRCRLLDAAGRLVAESAEVGDDWNCGLAEPVDAGAYTLVVEPETQLPGRSRIAVSMPAPLDAGAVRDGASYDLGTGGVLSAAIPPPAGDAVVEVALEADGPFSCAVDDDAGRLVSRAAGVRRCEAALAPGGRTWRLRAWTLDRPVRATARLAVRPVGPLERGRIEAGRAARARVDRPGRYRTGDGVRCLAGGGAGLLLPCGPEASLDAGEVLFVPGPGGAVALEEVSTPLDGGQDATLALERAPRIERQLSRTTAVHLVEVRIPPGERGAPACAMDGGVRVLGEGACFAASGATTASVLRLRADAPLAAHVRRAALVLPRAAKLAPGAHRLEVPEAGGLFRLPDAPARADLLLPPGAWAVLLVAGAAVDLCPPAPALHACRLEAAQRGELAILAPGERSAEASVVALPVAPAPRALAGLPAADELTLPLPGTVRWTVPAAPLERRLVVEGATRCIVALDDGTRVPGCEAAFPVGQGGEVRADHPAGPLRAAVWNAAEPLGRAGALPSGSPRALLPGEAAPLRGEAVDLGIELGAEAVVHVRAESGRCLLLSGGALAASDGLGGGCRLARLLPAGRHRLVVRAFAGVPLAGVASFSAEPVELLGEGVGPERWLAPGASRLFRFRVASRGNVGLGLREEAEALECQVSDAAGTMVGQGCQQLLALDAGDHVLAVSAPPGVPPMRFRPVLVGLAGAELGVPPEYLRDLLNRIGEKP